MKAIRAHEHGDADVLKYEDAPDPQVGPGQLLVRVKAVGVNPVDTYFRSGAYGPQPMPWTPGMDAAGVVEAVGEGVTRLKAGDRVYTAGSVTGTYAELTLCKEDQAYLLPERISFAQGAGVYVPYATAYRALFQKANAKPGDTVLIHGASGGVGTAALQMCRAAGITAVGSAGTEEGRKLVLEQGAAHAIDHTEEGYIDKAVEELTDGKGFNVILEMLSNVNLERDLDAIARGGRIVVIGSRGEIKITPRKIMAKEPIITGMVLMTATPEELASIHGALHAGLEHGMLSPVVGREMRLSEAAEAHRKVLEPGAHGKIVLVP